MLVVGDREVADGKVAVRLRSGDQVDPMGIDHFLTHITEKVQSKSSNLM